LILFLASLFFISALRAVICERPTPGLCPLLGWGLSLAPRSSHVAGWWLAGWLLQAWLRVFSLDSYPIPDIPFLLLEGAASLFRGRGSKNLAELAVAPFEFAPGGFLL
jgi:hypothetical protein